MRFACSLSLSLSLCLASGLAASCGSSKVTPPESTTPQPAAVPLESSVQPGRYTLTGRTVTDHCDESLVLAAKELSIDLAARSLRVDVVERSYSLDVRGDELVATGRFDPIDDCGTHQYIEVWRLRPRGPDTLEGQLTTYYRDVPQRDCLHACKFVTAIKAVKVGAAPVR